MYQWCASEDAGDIWIPSVLTKQYIGNCELLVFPKSNNTHTFQRGLTKQNRNTILIFLQTLKTLCC